MDGKQRRFTILLLYGARALRGFGDGFALIVLPAHLAAHGFSAGEIGLVAAAALFGTAVFTLSVGAVASRFDLRSLLLAGAGLMSATGIGFATADLFAIVLVVAFFGTINPSSGDIGVLIPIEHAMLTHEVDDTTRTVAFARYSLIGALSMAAGSLAAALPDFLLGQGIAQTNAFKMMFYTYAALGLASGGLYVLLPKAHLETRPSIAPLNESRGRVYKLAALFSVDAFAGGFIVQSLLALWLFKRFDMSLSEASVFFFSATLLSAVSYPLAARIARRFGLVNTMVWTHIPSSVCLILAALAPSLVAALALLLVRAALSQMDVPARSSYVMAVVTPSERPAAASITAVPRSLASSLGPAFGGALLASPYMASPLLICGVLKITYDLALLYSFRNIKPPEEQGT